MPNETLIQRFENYNRRHQLYSHDDKILLAVSGGVDSMVMLSLFVKQGYSVGVAHCNFSLRGIESDEDELMVLREAERYGVEIFNRRFDTVKEMEKTGESMEMAARRLRYDWFNEICSQHGYNIIAIAHHTDDSIETFFINLMRGTGLRGLTGINRRRVNVIRPLLFAERREIAEYAIANKLPYREDSTNRSTKYLRNKIRLGLLPIIRETNPHFTSIMRGNLYRLTDAQLFIEAAIADIRKNVVEQTEYGDRIHIERINPDYPRDFVIYEILSSSYGFKGDTVESMCHALNEGATGKRFFARDHAACIDRGSIVVAPIADDDSCQIEVNSNELHAYCSNSVLQFTHTDIDNVTEYNTPKEVALIDESKLKYPLILRRWQEGDTFIPFGMGGRKKVSDFLIDQKVPVIEKRRQYVLLSDDQIVWVVGRRIDDRFRINERTENILKITKEQI